MAYFSFTALVRNTLARAEQVNTIFQAVVDGFALLPSNLLFKYHRLFYAVDTGVVNAYVVALDPVPDAYQIDMTIDIVALLTNTGASTINVNGLGAKTILDGNGAVLVAGLIPAGRPTQMKYDGTQFRLNTTPTTTIPADGSVTVAKLAAPLSTMAANLSGSWNPATDDVTDLGQLTHRWGSAFFKSGGVLNWNNSNYTITHSAGLLTASGALTLGGALIGTTGTFSGVVKPSVDDAAALGAGATSWSDLFLASGAIINFANGNYTVIHSAGTATVNGNWLYNDGTVAHRMALISGGTVFMGTSSNHPVSMQVNNAVVGAFTTTGLSITGTLISSAAIKPSANDGTTLGISGTAFADIFLATGAVIDYGTGNMTVTHSAGGMTWLTSAGTALWQYKNTDPGAQGAIIQAFHDTASPAVTDTPLQLQVIGRSSTAVQRTYGAINCIITDPVNTSEDSQWQIQVQTAGAFATQMTIDGTQSTIPGAIAIGTAGNVRIGQNTTDSPGNGNNTQGFAVVQSTGVVSMSAANNTLSVNTTTDNTNVVFRSAGTSQGGISIAGATTTYGAFMGSHWSQLAGGAAKIEILRGTICEAIDEMSVWYAVRYTDHDGTVHHNEDLAAGHEVGAVVDVSYEVIEEEVSTVEYEVEIDVMEEIDEEVTTIEIVGGMAVPVTRTRKIERPALDFFPMYDADGLKVWDRTAKGGRRHRKHGVPRKLKETRSKESRKRRIITKTVKGEVILLANDQLPRFKISDTPGSKRVYGVFAWWHPDATNDANIGGLGAYVVRVRKAETIEGGELIESNGDGTGRIMVETGLSAIEVKQRHVATITANIVIETFDDGSRLFPCTLHCG